MNERVRQEYLEALGVRSFAPRFLLVGAKAPVRCLLPVERTQAPVMDQLPPVSVPASQIAVDHAQQSAVVAPPSANLDNVFPCTEGKSSNAAAKPSTSAEVVADLLAQTSVSDPQASDQRAAVFSLSVWRASESIYCIDSRRPGDALPTERLLSNILLGIGAVTKPLPPVEIVNWPLVHTNPDKSWAAARAMVKDFFDAKILTTSPVGYFFLFGRDAVAAFTGLEGDQFDAQLFTRHQQKIFDAEVMLLPSLADILHHPEHKAHLWRLLQSVRPR